MFIKIFKLMLEKLKFRTFLYVKFFILKEKNKFSIPCWGSPIPVVGGNGDSFIFSDRDCDVDGDWN